MIGCQSLSPPEPYDILLLENKEHELEDMLRTLVMQGNALVVGVNGSSSGSRIILKEGAPGAGLVFITSRDTSFFTANEEDGKPMAGIRLTPDDIEAVMRKIRR
jgi:hypothetical protein